MIKFLVALFLFLPLVSSSQTTLNLNNTLSGISSQTPRGTNTLINFSGQNSYSRREVSLDLLTNWQVAWSPSLSQDELVGSVNLGWRKPKWDLFTTYQYNHSLLRKIENDNWIGIGGGLKREFQRGKLSLSYASIWQRTNYTVLSDRELLRHSLRVRVKVDRKLFSTNIEYFFQPSFQDFGDNIVFGTTKVTFFPEKPLGLTLQNTLNYRSRDAFKLLQNTTLGISYKLSKTK